MQGPSASRLARTVLVVASTLAAGLGVGITVSAHDEIESSVPEHQSQFDDPISEVTINFGEPVDGVELALVGPDDVELPGEVTVISETEAKLEFEELTKKGEYLVRFLAEEDGHLVGGAISFVYGSRDAGGVSVTTWILFGLVAALILAIGAYFSLRRSARIHDDELADAAEFN